jgi:hypothetical protein
MAQITGRAIRWSTVAAVCTLFVVSIRFALPAQAVLTSDRRDVASPIGREWHPVEIDHIPVAAVPLPTESTGAQPVVAVSVPATAVIQVDDDGRVVAAMTNTGHPPRPDDDLWLMNPDGTMQPASAERFTEQVWIGDFAEPGVYVVQTR